jgi:hypothetical protein
MPCTRAAHTGGITDARGLSDSFAVPIARKGVRYRGRCEDSRNRPQRCGGRFLPLILLGNSKAVARIPTESNERTTPLWAAGVRQEGAGDASGNAIACRAVGMTNTLPRQRTRTYGKNNQHKQEQYPSRGRNSCGRLSYVIEMKN